MKLLQGPSIAALYLGVAIAAASFLGTLFYPLDIFSHFRPLIAIGLMFVSFVFLCLGWPLRAPIIAIFTAYTCLWSISDFPKTSASPPSAATSSHKDIKIITFNIWNYNTSSPEIAAFLKRENPDIIVFQELTGRAFGLVSQIKETHPYAVNCADNLGCRLGIFSKHAFSDTKKISEGGAQAPLLLARLDETLGGITIIGVHTYPPFSPYRHKQHMTSIDQHLMRTSSGPLILAGDFNSAPWAYHFKKILHTHDMRIATPSSNRPFATWPAFSPAPFLAIDNIIVSNEIEVIDVKRGPTLGSDHLPLISVLRVPLKNHNTL